MKRVAILLSLGVFLAVSCEKREQESQVPSVSFTPCQQSKLKSGSELSDKVDVEFTSKGVQITYYNFEVTCDFTTVNVTHTFANGVLNITQQGSPNQANCICYTDVSYTIDGILQDEVNVIFINGVQVYCYNDNNESEDISGIWEVKAINVSGELTNIGSPPNDAFYPNISITIPSTTRGQIDGNTFVNTIGFNFEIKEHQQISFENYGGTRIAEDEWGRAFRDHIMFNVVKFNISNNELQFIDSQDNSVIVFIDHLNKN